MIQFGVTFSTLGVPTTGLSPIITIRNTATGAVVINGVGMTEVGDGAYKYDFSNDTSIRYSAVIDGAVDTLDSRYFSVWSERAKAEAEQESLLYGKEVMLDTVNGSAGTAFPIGTRATPSNNLTDTLAICAANNLVRIMLRSDITIEATHNVDGMSIETHGILGTDVVFQSGCSANKTTIRYANISGTITDGDLLFIESCSVGNLANFSGIMNLATFGDGCEISLGSLGTWANFINCHCGGEPTNEPEISILAGALSVVNYSGNLKFTNKFGSDRTVASFVAGNISIASSCLMGKIQILGTGEIEYDYSGPGCTVDFDAALTNDYIADHVKETMEAAGSKLTDIHDASYKGSELTKVSDTEYTEKILAASGTKEFTITKAGNLETRTPV